MRTRVVGLIPAAGKSQRMGRPKLTLGLGELSVIQRVILALEKGGAEDVLVVAPAMTEPNAVVLANHARVEGAHVVHCPAPTSDMRATIEVGLDAMIEHALAPDAILLTPGDVPGLTPRVVAAVVDALRLEPERVVVPVYKGKRGHPVAMPWRTALQIHDLPPGVGVNELLARLSDQQIREVEVVEEGAVLDVDTPEEFQRWKR